MHGIVISIYLVLLVVLFMLQLEKKCSKLKINQRTNFIVDAPKSHHDPRLNFFYFKSIVGVISSYFLSKKRKDKR